MGHCIVLDVDGEPVRFQLNVHPDQLTDEDRAGLIELARAVRARSDALNPGGKTGSTPLATPTPCPCTYSTGPVRHHPTCPEYDALL